MGDVLADPSRPAVLLHVVNSTGQWGKGFTAGLAAKYPHAREDFLQWAQPCQGTLATQDPANPHTYRLGGIRALSLEPGLTLVHLCAQRGLFHPQVNPVPFQIQALEVCLRRCVTGNLFPSQGRILLPRIGSGLGRGDFEAVKKVLQDVLGDYDVRVYTLPGASL